MWDAYGNKQTVTLSFKYLLHADEETFAPVAIVGILL